MKTLLSLIPELGKEHVYIRDKDKVSEILHDLIDGGAEKLQVIADFDRTLTGFKRNGTTSSTCHNCLDESHHLPDFYREQAIKLRDHYFAIEIDHDLTKEEKYPYMVEWWTKAHDLLLQCNLTKAKISQVVRESIIFLRERVDWMFDELDKARVPLLIFSAGLGNVIEEVINQQSKLHPNMKIVSNYMDFDQDGNVTGFVGELIHTFNKNESAIHKSDYFKELNHRENVILLGDSIGDLHMAEGATDAKHILKIGFLNDHDNKIDKRLPLYKDSYDIVLVSDETMDIANGILKQIL